MVAEVINVAHRGLLTQSFATAVIYGLESLIVHLLSHFDNFHGDRAGVGTCNGNETYGSSGFCARSTQLNVFSGVREEKAAVTR